MNNPWELPNMIKHKKKTQKIKSEKLQAIKNHGHVIICMLQHLVWCQAKIYKTRQQKMTTVTQVNQFSHIANKQPISQPRSQSVSPPSMEPTITSWSLARGKCKAKWWQESTPHRRIAAHQPEASETWNSKKLASPSALRQSNYYYAFCTYVS